MKWKWGQGVEEEKEGREPRQKKKLSFKDKKKSYRLLSPKEVKLLLDGVFLNFKIRL